MQGILNQAVVERRINDHPQRLQAKGGKEDRKKASSKDMNSLALKVESQTLFPAL